MAKDNHVEALTPGCKCWIIADEEHLEGKKKVRYRTMGADGNLTYVGYQIIGGNSFLVLDEAQKGHGKHTKVRTFLLNADRIIYTGAVE